MCRALALILDGNPESEPRFAESSGPVEVSLNSHLNSSTDIAILFRFGEKKNFVCFCLFYIYLLYVYIVFYEFLVI